MLLATCVTLTFAKHPTIAFIVTWTSLKIMLWDAVALQYTDKEACETNGFGRSPV